MFELLRTNWFKNVFLKDLVEYKCFWKTFHLILMHSIHKILCFEEFLHKIILFFKNLVFPDFRLIKCDFRSIEKFQLLPDSIGIRSMLDRSKLKNFQFLSIWPIYFFTSFIFRIRMHCIIFCIHLAVLQSYLSLFSHIPCIHFAKFGTQLDLKIDWLIFESFVHFSIFYFLCVNCRKFFS